MEFMHENTAQSLVNILLNRQHCVGDVNSVILLVSAIPCRFPMVVLPLTMGIPWVINTFEDFRLSTENSTKPIKSG